MSENSYENEAGVWSRTAIQSRFQLHLGEFKFTVAVNSLLPGIRWLS